MRCNKLLGLGCFLLALAGALSPDPALSATATTTFQVTTNVMADRTISATNMVFGDYADVRLTAQSQVEVNCTNSTRWNIGLDAGTCPSGLIIARCMTGPGSALLNYNLFSNPFAATVWGNTLGVDTVAGEGQGGTQVITVFGVLPGGQSVPPGGYADTITATVSF